MTNENEQIKSFVLESLQQGKDFIITQAPDVIQQVVSYGYISSMIGFICCAIIFLLSIFAVIWSIISDIEWGGIPFCFGIISAIISFLFAFAYLSEMIHAYYFPKSYLLNMFL